MNIRRDLFLFAVLVVVFCLPALSQTETAVISGRVADPQGAVVKGADLVIVNIDTNVSSAVTTNDRGIYVFPSVQPGRYRMTVRSTGFKEIVETGLVVHVQDTISRNYSLEVGATTETVTVVSDQAVVNTESATVGTVVDRQFVGNMPLNGRSFQSLISLTPGVVTTLATSDSAGQFSINGQRPNSNYFTVDGVSANVGVGAAGSILSAGSGSGIQTTAGGGLNNLASVDAIQEFKIQTSTFAPEFGRSPGGQISIVTRSGSNQFHGNAFDYLRNNALDANDWFNNSLKLPRPVERQNDFGGVIGGPIWKNKLFFFGSYEGLRLTIPKTLVLYVPSTSARNNTVAAMKPLLNAYPQPTAGGCGALLAASPDPNLAPFCGQYGAKNTLDARSLRVDYNINSKMSMFGRWNYAPSHAIDRTSALITASSPDLTTWTGGFTYAMTSTVVNDLRYNFSSAIGNTSAYTDTLGGAVPLPDSTLFRPGFDANTDNFTFQAQGIGQFQVGNAVNNGVHQYNLIDNVSVTRGAHQLKFGVDFRRLAPVKAPRTYQQAYIFGLFIASTTPLITGVPDEYLVLSNVVADLTWQNLSFYGQDTWKITPRLTLTYGLRWDYNPPPGSTNGNNVLALNQVDLNNPAATQVLPIGSAPYEGQWNAFAPRVGVAYQLSQDPRWGRVLRGGWGMFFDTGGDVEGPTTAGGGTNTFLGPALSASPTITAYPAPAALQTPPALQTAPPWTSVAAISPTLRAPYVYQMNMALEQSLGTKQSLTATYAGAIGRSLLTTYAFPRPNANLPNGYSIKGNGGSSDYHSLQLLFQRRLSAGLQAMASYTWAHSLDTGSISNSGVPVGGTAISGERGPSDFDIRHSFQSAISYSLPRMGSNPLVQAVLGHWGTDIIFRARTAQPVNVTDSTSSFAALLPSRRVNTRPDVVSGAPLYLYGPQFPGGKALNPAAFIQPAPCAPSVSTACNATRQGTLGRNALRGFGWNQADFTLRRDFPIHESIALQFRTDFFNLMNHPSFAFSILNVAGGPTFGRSNVMLNGALGQGGTGGGYSPLYQIGGPRSVQMSLKLLF